MVVSIYLAKKKWTIKLWIRDLAVLQCRKYSTGLWKKYTILALGYRVLSGNIRSFTRISYLSELSEWPLLLWRAEPHWRQYDFGRSCDILCWIQGLDRSIKRLITSINWLTFVYHPPLVAHCAHMMGTDPVTDYDPETGSEHRWFFDFNFSSFHFFFKNSFGIVKLKVNVIE